MIARDWKGSPCMTNLCFYDAGETKIERETFHSD